MNVPSPLRVFVSYNHDDGEDPRDHVCDKLSRAGFAPWFDEKVREGGFLSEELSRAISDSQACVPVVTAEWLDSHWCLAEAAAFHFGERPLIPYVPDKKLVLPGFLRDRVLVRKADQLVKGLTSWFGIEHLAMVRPQVGVEGIDTELLSAVARAVRPISAESVGSEFESDKAVGPVIVLMPSEAMSDAAYVAGVARLVARRAPALIIIGGRENARSLQTTFSRPGARLVVVSVGDDALSEVVPNWIAATPGGPSPSSWDATALEQLRRAQSIWREHEELGVRRAARDLSKRLDAFSRVHRVGLERTKRTLEHMAKGVFFIHEADDIYDHDREALLALKPGEFYWSTHPTWANPGSATSRRYAAYIDALLEAQRHQVEVVRIYLVDDDLAAEDALPEHLTREIQRLNDGDIRTYVVGRSACSDECADDFVIIGERVFGHAEPLHGVMARSRYAINSEFNDLEFRKYRDYFMQLRDSGQEINLKDMNADEPAYTCTTSVRLPDRSAKRYMAVLRTVGCAWDRGNTGCTMCDFKRHALPNVTTSNLEKQLDAIVGELDDATHVDLLTLGSFLHDLEVPPSFRQTAMQRLGAHPRVESVLIESRAEYVSAAALAQLAEYLGPGTRLELGLGVETRNVVLRNKVLQKGLSDEAVLRVMAACRDADVGFVGYVLIKPHTLSEVDAVRDAIESASWIFEEAANLGVRARVAYEPVFITRGTTLEREYFSGRYELVNLWSVVHVATIAAQRGWNVFFGMSDEGLSDRRMPRSCPACSDKILRAIERFNETGDSASFGELSCSCRSAWLQDVQMLPDALRPVR